MELYFGGEGNVPLAEMGESSVFGGRRYSLHACTDDYLLLDRKEGDVWSFNDSEEAVSRVLEVFSESRGFEDVRKNLGEPAGSRHDFVRKRRYSGYIYEDDEGDKVCRIRDSETGALIKSDVFGEPPV